MAAAVRARETPPPPIIGKAGNYTVFITPPTTPTPSEPRTPPTVDTTTTTTTTTTPRESSLSSPSPFTPLPSPKAASPESFRLSGSKPPSPPPPPVQVPPLQLEKKKKNSSGFGFFWDAVSKVQHAHSSLDEYLADWFGLNQSKYQWALNDYYQSNGMDKSGKTKELVNKENV